MYVGMIEARSLKIFLKSFHENYSDLFKKQHGGRVIDLVTGKDNMEDEKFIVLFPGLDQLNIGSPNHSLNPPNLFSTTITVTTRSALVEQVEPEINASKARSWTTGRSFVLHNQAH